MKRTAAHVADHRALNPIRIDAHSQNGCNRLLNQNRFPHIELHRRFQKRPPLQPRHLRRHTNRQPQMIKKAPHIRLIQKRFQKIHRRVVADDIRPLNRTDDADILRRASFHQRRFCAKCDALPRLHPLRHDRRLPQDRFLFLHIERDIGRPQIDADILRAK